MAFQPRNTEKCNVAQLKNFIYKIKKKFFYLYENEFVFYIYWDDFFPCSVLPSSR